MDDAGYIFCLMGKSASGKDTLYRLLRERFARPGEPCLREVVPYTTRPIRTGETDGREYIFETGEQFARASDQGRVIESRSYHTAHGLWTYYTKDDGQIDLAGSSYLIIGTLESYRSFQNYYGPEHLVPLYTEVENGERLQRALRRERAQTQPRYAEMCRRFLADEEDFSEERLTGAGITRRFENRDAADTAQAMYEVILKTLRGEGTPAG